MLVTYRELLVGYLLGFLRWLPVKILVASLMQSLMVQVKLGLLIVESLGLLAVKLSLGQGFALWRVESLNSVAAPSIQATGTMLLYALLGAMDGGISNHMEWFVEYVDLGTMHANV